MVVGTNFLKSCFCLKSTFIKSRCICIQIICLGIKKTQGKNKYIFTWINSALARFINIIISLCLRPRKKKDRQWALHVYSIANFIASWLKWLQMIWNDSKWVFMCLKNQLRSFEFIWNHLESFKSWVDKISYTINMQRSLAFFVGSQTQCCPHQPDFQTIRQLWQSIELLLTGLKDDFILV